MNAQNLYTKSFKGLGEWEYKDSGIFFCEKCRLVYSTQALAEECCAVKKCKCGGDCEKYYQECPTCVQKTRDRIEQEKFNKAQKIDIKDYTGYLLCGEWAHDDYKMYLDNYFENECEFNCPLCDGETEAKSLANPDKDSYLSCKSCAWNSPAYEVIDDIYYLFAPEYIWATEFKPLKIDFDWVFENSTEEHHESVHDHIKGLKELKTYIENWNEMNKDVGSYEESRKLALINIKDYVKKIYNKV